jgi:hypothetical protein
MPFAHSHTPLYEFISGLVQNHCHLRCVRADSESRGGRIMADVWRLTNEAILVIADLSGRNPNVFYETGLAHALGKRVILLSSDTDDIPFDVRDIDIIRYDVGAGFEYIRDRLLDAVRAAIVTLPERNNAQNSQEQASSVRITHVICPSSVVVGQPIEITVHARNHGLSSVEGYFSVSFPEAVDAARVEIVETSASRQIGLPRQPWRSRTLILSYPIAEAFASPWAPGQEHFLWVRARSHRPGWLPCFINAGSFQGEERAFATDPNIQSCPHMDQRGERVYCGVVDVVA